MITIEQAPYFELPFLNAAPGRQRVAVRERLPFLRAVVSGLPRGAPPIVATADLQGRSEFGDTDDSLLGCAVADALPEVQAAAGLPAPQVSLGLLAGDFYSIPNAMKRGGLGDVGEVWSRMHRQFSRVAGVLGNHDQFGESARSRHRPEGFLDGAILEMDGLRVGGVSGIVGDSGRPNRRSPDEFAESLITVLALRPDILLLHAAPESDEGAPGDASIADWIRSTDFAGLIVCGHVHWDERVQRCGRATVLNVDGAVVTLVPAG